MVLDVGERQMKILISMAENSGSSTSKSDSDGKIEMLTAHREIEEKLAQIFVEEIELRRKKLKVSKKKSRNSSSKTK